MVVAKTQRREKRTKEASRTGVRTLGESSSAPG